MPGMVAGMIRHLHSLRLMRKDRGWIHTLLEEAENERMHLMTFMDLKKPGAVLLIVCAAQCSGLPVVCAEAHSNRVDVWAGARAVPSDAATAAASACYCCSVLHAFSNVVCKLQSFCKAAC